MSNPFALKGLSMNSLRTYRYLLLCQQVEERRLSHIWQPAKTHLECVLGSGKPRCTLRVTIRSYGMIPVRIGKPLITTTSVKGATCCSTRNR